MTQTIKTLLFVVMAAVSIGVAAGTYYANRPVDLDDFVDVGEKFYPDFQDPNEATGLQVAAYQDETGKTELFKVDFKNGLWRIPSHHDYPADAQDRLAKTAASMVGVTRLALGERTKAAHKKYNLVDPLDKDASTEGRGDRVTLYKGDAVLVDFIVGKKVENSNNLYYVRRADEERFYTADLGQFDVTTKFSDWIKQDVLEIRPDDVKEVLIGRYYVDEVQGKVVPQETIDLKRAGEQGEWKLEGLKKDKEKLKASEITSLVTALDGLQIVGVRPKPPGLSAALKGDADTISIDPFVQRDMVEKGVFINRRNEFVYNEGKVNVGLNNGVNYELGFGEEFTGSEFDIEVGKPAEPKPAEEAAKIAEEVEKKDGDKKEDEKSADEKKDDGKKTSRYLFVTAFFDKDLLGPAPKAPLKPEPPKEEAKPEEPKAEESKDADKKSADEKADAKPEEAEKKDEKKEEKPSEKPVDKKAEYEKALEEYKIQSEVYELQKKDYDAKVKAGEERVAELNRRFADWYYVIPEESFLKLKLQRASLVEAVEVAAEQTPDAPKKDGAMSAGEKPAAPQPATEKPSAEKPEAMKPAAEKPADKPAEPKPAEPKPEEKAPAADKAEMKTPAEEKKEPQVEEKKKETEPAKSEESKPAEPKPAEPDTKEESKSAPEESASK